MEELDVIRIRLSNWSRWARDNPIPDLDARISAIYSLAAHRINGWGDPHPDDLPPPIYEQDAELIDRAIRNLSVKYRTAILRQYLHFYSVDRLLSDAAARALGDAIAIGKILP